MFCEMLTVQEKKDNAIILAAGLAKRCLPLSKYAPKGLFIVKGEPLIERQIRQIKESGINDIIIVVGYLAHKYDYLIEKYNVKLINNPEYGSTNNISSLWYARNYLAKSYICGSDNWFEKNVFNDKDEDSYFSSFYTDGYVDEYCIEEDQNGWITRIKKGGNHCRYTLGEIYINQKLSDLMLKRLSSEYQISKNMILDDYCIKHIDEFRFKSLHREEGDILEFDTIEEFCSFDQNFMVHNASLCDGE